jgi:hypothetical protein
MFGIFVIFYKHVIGENYIDMILWNKKRLSKNCIFIDAFSFFWQWIVVWEDGFVTYQGDKNMLVW